MLIVNQFTPGGSGKLSPQNGHPGSKATGTDGSMESETSSEYSSVTGSTASSPKHSVSFLLDGTNDRRSVNIFTSRSGSPGPITSSGYNTSSMGFGYPYHQAGYLPESLAPTAIRG